MRDIPISALPSSFGSVNYSLLAICINLTFSLQFSDKFLFSCSIYEIVNN